MSAQARYIPPFRAITVVLGLLLTVALCGTAYEEVSKNRAEVFAAQGALLRDEVSRRARAIEEAAHGLYTLFHSATYVDPDQFRLFSQGLITRHGLIGGTYYLPRVAAAERESTEQSVRRAGYAGFRIHGLQGRAAAPVPPADSHFPITYIDPLTPNSAALLGLDLASNPRFAAAIQQAVTSGRAVGVEAGGVFPLADERGDFVVFQATYAGKQSPRNDDERVSHVNGVVAIWVVGRTLLAGTDSSVGMELSATLSAQRAGPFAHAGPDAHSPPTLHARSETLYMAGLPLQLQLSSTARLEAADVALIGSAAALGLLLTALLGHTARNVELRAHMLAERNAEIARLVDERTHRLAEETSALAREVAERRRVETILRASEASLAHAHRIARLITWEWNPGDDTIQWGADVDDVLGVPAQKLGTTLSEYLAWVHPEDQGTVREVLQQVLHTRSPLAFEHRLLAPDGGTRQVRGQAELRQGDPDARWLIVGTLQEITQLRRVEERSRQLSRALEQTADAVMITDRNGRIEYVNPAFEAVTQYTRDEVLGRTPNVVRSGKHDPAFYSGLWRTLLAGEVFRDVLINAKKDGTLYYEEKTITPIKDGRGQITHFIATGKDITERIQTEQRLYFLAHHDVLTTLPNRAMLLERLERALVHGQRHKTSVAVLFLDLDRFKMINDTLGHDVGDRLLTQIADRLRPCLRQEDTVARLGGDEFTVLLENILQLTDVSKVAGKLLDAIAQPFVVDNMELFVTGSIGISMYPSDGDTAHTLLKHADTAMYQAKDQGGNTFRFYAADMSARAIQRLELETNLRRALSRREFVLFYQPLVNAQSGRIAGVEALLRWQHPVFGLVPPNDCVPVLEDTGLIGPVGEWVLREACAQYCRWHADGIAPTRLSVNLSGRQFNDDGLRENIGRIISETGMNPGALNLEITETVIMENAEKSIAAAASLAKLGVRFAVDDFGTGYSSLSYLRRLPINTLKIDRSFVREVAANSDDAAIVSTIVAMAHSLQLDVVAEGVENAEQAAFLRDCACDYLQGYHFGEPVTAQHMGEILAQSQVSAADARYVSGAAG